MPYNAEAPNSSASITATPSPTSGQSLVSHPGACRPDQIGGASGGAGGPISGSAGRPHVGQNRAAAGNSPPHLAHTAIPAIVTPSDTTPDAEADEDPGR